MHRKFLAATALLCAWQPLRAQDQSGPISRALTISAGIYQENRRDAADSPLAYSGNGPGGRIDYDWTRGSRRWHFALSGSTSNLAPSTSLQQDVPSTEAFHSFGVEVGTDWRLNHVASRIGSLAVGVEFASNVTIAQHLYAGQDLSEQSFDLATITLAPTVRWTKRAGPGEFRASLAVPLLAWVDHPYGDVRFATQFSEVHFVSPAQYRQATGGLTYAFHPERRYGATAAYRLSVFDLSDVEPVRRVSQSLTIGFVWRFDNRGSHMASPR
jgi:hypothetical protein